MDRTSEEAVDAARSSAAELLRLRGELSAAVVAREFDERPELDERFGPQGRERCLEDAGRHVDYLATAVAQQSPSLFNDYVEWATVLLGRLGIPDEDVRRNLMILRDMLKEKLGADDAMEPQRVIDGALQRLTRTPAEPATFLDAGPHAGLARRYLDALLRQDRRTATSLVTDAVESGVPVRDIYLHVFQPVQYEVGRLWQIGEIGVAEEHYCTAATQVIMARLYPYVFGSRSNGRRMVAACVDGDLHEIGLRMIADFFEMDGWDSAFIGASTPPSSLVKLILADPPDLLAISATMTFHVRMVAEIIAQVRRRVPDVRIIVGGYPFRVEPELWRRVGADAVAADAEEAVERARRLFEADTDAA